MRQSSVPKSLTGAGNQINNSIDKRNWVHSNYLTTGCSHLFSAALRKVAEPNRLLSKNYTR